MVESELLSKWKNAVAGSRPAFKRVKGLKREEGGG